MKLAEKKLDSSPKFKSNDSQKINLISQSHLIEVQEQIEKPEIKQIIENLKRRENFENGIRNLYELLLANPGKKLII